VKAVNYLKRQSKPVLVALAVVLVGLLGALDWLTGSEVSFSIFFLVPIWFSVWFTGRRVGMAVSMLSAVTWLTVELLWGRTYTHPLIPYWNGAVRLGFFMAVAFLLSSLKALQETLETKVQERTAALAAENRERRIVEERLRVSEQRFRQLAESITEVFWMTDVDKTQMIYISPSYETIWGRSCESLYRAPNSWLEAIHPQDRDRLLAAAMTEQASGQYDQEYRIVRPDGSVRWIRDRAFPVRNEAGDVYRITGIAEDITERKLAEVQVATLAHAVESTAEMICITDPQDRFIFVNRAFQKGYGYTEEEILGKTPEVLFSPKNPPALLAQILEQTHSGGWRGEVLDRRKDGTELPIFLSTSEIRDETGRVIGLMGVAQDITERKRLEREILEISAGERRRIGHELHDGLGQYLTGIAFRAKVLEQTLADEAPPRARDANEIAQLISNAISQTRSLARGFDPVEVEGGGLVAALHNLTAETERFFGVTCAFRCCEPALRLEGHTALALYRIGQEAIHNALQHGKARRIEVELSLDTSLLCLKICDKGEGFGSDATRKDGMGLRIMDYRARSIGASLKVSSQLHVGTEICCFLPRAASLPAAGPTTDTQQ
jgi:PAS domain S-box-containing protein